MDGYKVTYVGDKKISNVHHIGIEYNGNYYSVIFGEYVNGGFFSIPNWKVCGELAELDDISWNTEAIGNELNDINASKAIAIAIAKFVEK